MKPNSTLAISVAMLAGAIAYLLSASGRAQESSAPVYLSEIPAGYRD